jgi:flavodoxin
MGKALVCYFSQFGSTEAFANNIVAKLQADGREVDVFKITPVVPYPDDYDMCLSKAMEDRAMMERPEYVGDVDLSQYQTVFLGYPIWCSDMPMIIYNFLEKHTFTDIRLYPFCTHGGTGDAGTFTNIGNLAVGAVRKEGLAIESKLAKLDGGKKQAEYWVDQAEV